MSKPYFTSIPAQQPYTAPRQTFDADRFAHDLCEALRPYLAMQPVAKDPNILDERRCLLHAHPNDRLFGMLIEPMFRSYAVEVTIWWRGVATRRNGAARAMVNPDARAISTIAKDIYRRVWVANDEWRSRMNEDEQAVRYNRSGLMKWGTIVQTELDDVNFRGLPVSVMISDDRAFVYAGASMMLKASLSSNGFVRLERLPEIDSGTFCEVIRLIAQRSKEER